MKTFIFILLILFFLAVCPWFTKDQAAAIVLTKAQQLVAENPRLCATYLNEDSITRVPFGYREDVSYDCSVTDPDLGIPKEKTRVYILFYGGVVGMPSKSVNI